MKLITTRTADPAEERSGSGCGLLHREEPYTLAMVLKEALPEGLPCASWRRILTGSLGQSRAGIYPATIKNEVDRYYMAKYFRKHAEGYEVLPELRACVTFRQFNLMHPFPFKTPWISSSAVM